QHSDVTFITVIQQHLEILAVVRALHGDVVARQEHRVEIKTVKAAAVGGRDLRAVPRDSDPPDEALLAREERGVEGAARTQGLVPLDGIGERMELPQVDASDG